VVRKSVAYVTVNVLSVPGFPSPGFPQRVGVSLQEANQIIDSPAAQHMVDNLHGGNINSYQTINGQIIRITTDPSAQRIISAGIVQARNIAAGINSGRFTPAP
jgi:hypothetical protein